MSHSLAEKKAAAFAALANMKAGTICHDPAVDLTGTPHAPFDFNDEEGTPHRVRAYGKTLKVCFLRDGVEEPIRSLGEGELERLWEKRIR